jgi:hypothetical protein
VLNLSSLRRSLLAAMLLVSGLAAAAESFSIAPTQDQSRLWLQVNGSGSIERQDDGVMIRFDELHFSSPYRGVDPAFILSVRIQGSDMTGSGRTGLMHSERLPIRRNLRGGESFVVRSDAAIYMPYPDWTQREPRFDLAVELRDESGVDAQVPIATTLHELGLPSLQTRRTETEVREIRAEFSYLPWILFGAAAIWLVKFVNARKRAGREPLLALVLFVFVWNIGAYPMLRAAYAQFWPAVEAEIVDVGIKTQPPAGKVREFSYRPIVKYAYEVDGRHADYAIPAFVMGPRFILRRPR